MKGFTVVLFIACAVVFAEAYPKYFERQVQTNPSDDVEEVEIIPQERRSRLPTFVEIDPTMGEFPDFLDSRFNPFGTDNPFNNFMKRMQETLTGLHDRIDTLMKRIPDNAENGTIFDLGNGPVQNKSTSTTKVIDGHVVTVNETTYSTGGDGDQAVFHFEIVEVKPTDIPNRSIEDSTSAATEKTGESELDDAKTEETNEIPKEQVSFNEWDSSEALTNPDPSHNEIDSNTFNEFDDVDPFEVFNSYDEQKPGKEISLSGDTLVNKLVSDQAQGGGYVMIDPDAELIDVGDMGDMDTRPGYFEYKPTQDVELLRMRL